MAKPSIKSVPFEPRQVPLLDVGRDNIDLRESILARISDVFDSGRFLHGPDVAEAEASVAALSQTRHAVACASGSDALLLSLMAAGIGPGDEVIVPSFTFFATASAVARLGATIVFADIDPATFNVDPDCVAQAVTSRTKAIIPVHLFGQCAAMDRLCQIAEQRAIDVVEDAAQAIGARFQGRPAGSWGQTGCFSFYPTKNIGGCGDGGMLTTQSDDWAQRLRLFAAHGMSPRYIHKVIGINSRLDSMQAAVLNVKLANLKRWTVQRRNNADRYQALFTEAGLHDMLKLPSAADENYHVWNQYTIRVPDGRRDELRAYLAKLGVGSEVYYPIPLHLQECFRDQGFAEGSLPETERAALEVLSLPIFPGLTHDEQRVVVGRIAEFYRAEGAAAA